MTAESRTIPELNTVFMRTALRLARRGYGRTSPNPMVGAILVKGGRIIGGGWHRAAGQPHAEVEAMQDARRRGYPIEGATLYVTLEPCSTHGRTPPCTDAILASGIAEVIVGATDPNPKHGGQAFDLLRGAGVRVVTGVCADECARLNEAFNHWIVHRTPFVTVKAAMTLDGKIATASGESRWITGLRSRAASMRLRRGTDAILVGVNTIVKDNPRLTARRGERETGRSLRRIVLDPQGRMPKDAHVLNDASARLTTWVVAEERARVSLHSEPGRVEVWAAPAPSGKIDLPWLLTRLGQEGVVHLLVEGGGEVNASFLLGGFAHRVIFFYAPLILGGRQAPTGVEGSGVPILAEALRLRQVAWRALGADLMLTGLASGSHAPRNCC